MNKKLNSETNNTYREFKKITYAGIFLSIIFLVIIIQIPIPLTFFKFDFSVAVLLYSIPYIGICYGYFIGIFSPLILFLTGGEIVGITFLILINILIVSFNLIYEKTWLKDREKSSYLFYFPLIIFLSIIFSFLSVLIFTPIYINFDYELIFSNFYKYFLISFSFNFIKLLINYFVYYILIRNFKL